MKFKTKEDIDAPMDYVFGALTDFEALERQAMRRGASVRRMDAQTQPGEGMGWEIGFPFRGKPRELTVTMMHFAPPSRMSFDGTMQGLSGTMDVELLALSRTRTRMILEIELKPETLSARLLMQSIKLARGSINKRFQVRVAEYAKTMEERYGRMA